MFAYFNPSAHELGYLSISRESEKARSFVSSFSWSVPNCVCVGRGHISGGSVGTWLSGSPVGNPPHHDSGVPQSGSPYPLRIWQASRAAQHTFRSLYADHIRRYTHTGHRLVQTGLCLIFPASLQGIWSGFQV